MVLEFFSRQRCSHPPLVKEASRSASHLRTHLRTTRVSVPSRQCGPHSQLKEEAAPVVNPWVTASPCARFQQLKEAAAPLPNPHRKASPTSYFQQGRLRSEPKEAAAPLANPWVTASPCARFQQLKEEAAPLANPHQPSNPTVHLQQHCARPEPTEEAAPLARHPYWAPSQPVLREAPQARAQEQLQKIEAVPAGELQRGQRLCQPGEAGPPPPTVPSARSAAGPRWLRRAPWV